MFVNLDLRKHAEDLVDKARMAPSLRNAQPWAFRVKPDAVEVYADRSRRIPTIDPDDRQLLIGVGAAVYAIRLGISMLGVEPTISLLPGAERGDLAALVSVGPDHVPSLAEARLMEQVPVRRTVRSRMNPCVSSQERGELTAAAASEAATLVWIGDPEPRRVLAHLVALAQRRRAAESRVASGGAGTGTAVVNHGLETVSAVAEPPLEEPESEPSVAVLTTDGDRPTDWLRAGQALMRALLTATADGLGAAYINLPLELPDIRPRVRDELALAGFPQLILRFGRPLDGWPLPTPRRPICEVLRPRP